MRYLRAVLALAACLLWPFEAADAASLRVAPTSLSLVAPNSASTLTLRNDGSHSINVQIRVFKWTQVNGTDRLETTRDVVASPPAVTLAPGGATVVRIVRVSTTAVSGEESYRVLVDELPDPARRRAGTVSLLLRYSIPVFFASPGADSAVVAWSVSRRDGITYLIGANSGKRHQRIAELTVKDGSGRAITLSEGLAGYVLGGSIMAWPLPGRDALALSGRSVTVTAMSETGQINAVAAPR